MHMRIACLHVLTGCQGRASCSCDNYLGRTVKSLLSLSVLFLPHWSSSTKPLSFFSFLLFTYLSSCQFGPQVTLELSNLTFKLVGHCTPPPIKRTLPPMWVPRSRQLVPTPQIGLVLRVKALWVDAKIFVKLKVMGWGWGASLDYWNLPIQPKLVRVIFAKCRSMQTYNSNNTPLNSAKNHVQTFSLKNNHYKIWKS